MAQRRSILTLEPRPFPLRAVLLCLLLGLMLCVAQGQGEGPVAADNAASTQAQQNSRFPAKLSTRGEPIEVKIRLPDTDDVELVELTDGSYRYLLYQGGRTESLTPQEFTQRLATREGTPLKTLLNITTPAGIAWVAVGFLGQFLFTGRMVVQWFVSEKHKRSVVPVSFWWMSLGGGAMLMTYFIWRKDIVGVLGQSTGVLIYARNLWLILIRGGEEQKTMVEGGEGDIGDRDTSTPGAGDAEEPTQLDKQDHQTRPGADGTDAPPPMGEVSQPAIERGKAG